MSIVEILISICIIAIVLALLFTLLIQVRHEDTDNNIQSNFIINQSTYIKTIEEDIVNYGIKSVENCTLADANIREDTVAKGQQDNIKCIKIVYAADYLKENVGFILVYNHYRSYDIENGSYIGRDASWGIQYMRGSYKCDSNKQVIRSTWKSPNPVMKEIPSEVDMSQTPYVLYTAASGANTYNAASIVLPIINLDGEHYDINLSYTFKNNDNFTCDNTDDSKLKCICQSDATLCKKTYTGTDNKANVCA
ncbi:MAG: hypothetical protein K2L98_01100, partial [Bacilli bacterium]|nr:hypothetical protein [Bacilli bacterium]